MTKIFFSLIFFTAIILCNIKNVSGQSQTEGPNTGGQQYFACLSCPGTMWNNMNDVTAADSVPASTLLFAAPKCIQTTCFYSRGLLGSNFKFSIPTSATILGISVSVRKKAGATNTADTAFFPIRDSIIQLLDSLAPVGANMKSNMQWPKYYSYQGYGDSINLWNYSWTPALVNETGFGVLVKCLRMPGDTAYMTAPAYVDYMKVKIWYSVTTGIVEVQERDVHPSYSPTVYPNPVNESSMATVKISLNEPAPITTDVFDMTGRKVSSSYNEGEEGINEFPIKLNNVPNGIYFVRIAAGTNSWVKKLVKE